VLRFISQCLAVTLLTVIASPGLFAQPKDRQIVNQSIEWFSIATNLKVSKRTSLLVEGQFRQAQNMQPMQYQFRTGAEFAINKHLSVMPLGYVYTWNFKYGKQPMAFENNEHRIYEQATYKHAIGRFSFSHRARLEQRFLQVHSKNTDGDVTYQGYDMYMNRLRYRFQTMFPLNHEKIQDRTFFATAYDEVFLDWGKPVTFHEPDQNRLFAGFGYQFKSPLSIQVGYLYHMLIKANGAQQENNTGIQVALTYNINLMKAQ